MNLSLHGDSLVLLLCIHTPIHSSFHKVAALYICSHPSTSITLKYTNCSFLQPFTTQHPPMFPSILVSLYQFMHPSIHPYNPSNVFLHFHANDYIIFTVNPRPHRLLVDGCNSQQHCVLEVQRTGNVTCSIYRIRPEVNLQWRSFNDDSVLSLLGEQTRVTQQEDTLDISLTTYFEISSSVNGKVTLECYTSGENSNIFQLSVIVDLMLGV